MRRFLAALAVTALSAASPAVAAPRSAAVSDAAGDWPAAAQDIVRVRLGMTRVGEIPAVRGVLTLAGPPDVNAPHHYAVSFTDGCHIWGMSVNMLQRRDPAYSHSACQEARSKGYLIGAEDTASVMLEVSGNDLVFTAFFNHTLRPGAKVTALAGTAGVHPSVFWDTSVNSLGRDGWVGPGDRASGPVTYVLR